jgi:hypothetical protein
MSRLACFCLAILALLSGCEVARMQVSRDLADAQPFAVERTSSWRKPEDPLTFGQWHTTGIDVGWGKFRSHAAPIGKAALEFESYEKPFHFDLEASDGVISAECIARAEAVAYKDWSLDSGALKGIPPLHCAYYGAAEGEMEFFEMPTLASSEEGKIDFGVTRWDLQSVNRIEGSRGPGSIVGYEIRLDNEVIAAVELINGGRVWMSPDLTSLEQDRVASVAMALLLYESPQNQIESLREIERDD